jgi:ParB family chromosome partitioning protein
MKPKTRLGKGLHALIPDTSSIEVPLKSQPTMELDVALIETNPYQPRVVYDEVAFEELKKSIEEKGIIQPILVRPVEDGRYQIVAGERRFRAVVDLGIKSIPAYIRDVTSEEDMLEIALIENLQREHLNPIDLGKGYLRLIEDCSLTQEDVAKKIGKDRATIANVIRLLKLPPVIQKSLQQCEIREGHARALLGISHAQTQKLIWQKAIKDNLSVRKVELLVKKYQKANENPNRDIKVKPRKSGTIVKMESKLREKLGTQVKIRSRKESGAIEISFYSMEDLQRLMDIFDQIKY